MTPRKNHHPSPKPPPSLTALPTHPLRPLAEMPVDEVYMELAVLRATAGRSLDLLPSCARPKEQLRAVLVSVAALNAAANQVFKLKSLNNDAPLLSDVWDSIAAASRLNDLDGDPP